MQIHQLKRDTKNYKPPRVGRGGKRGKTSGRGTKGQLARAGHKVRPQMRDTIKKLPKLRGRGRNYNKTVKEPNIVVNLGLIESNFNAGDVISMKTLVAKKLIRITAASNSKLKVLATGDLTKKLSFEKCLVSDTAKEKIEKAGGTITL